MSLLCNCSKEDTLTDMDWSSIDSIISHHYQEDTLYYIIDKNQMSRAIASCTNSNNKGISVGVFGGSHTCYEFSDTYYDILKKYLLLDITVYGVGGASYSNLRQSIQSQVDNAEPKDLYILWGTTNDFNSECPLGSVTDYTCIDNWNEEKLSTQCGGTNYAIKKLREINPECKIIFMGAMKFFVNNKGYDNKSKNTNSTGKTYREYIEAQKLCAQNAGVPFFDSYSIIPFNKSNYAYYYLEDRLHFRATAYQNIAYYHLEFIANN